MSLYSVSIISPDGKAFSGDIESLIAPGALGLIQVLAQHTPIVATLKPGVLTIMEHGVPVYFAIGSGVLEVDGRHNALVLTDFALKVGSVIEALEQLQKKEALL